MAGVDRGRAGRADLGRAADAVPRRAGGARVGPGRSFALVEAAFLGTSAEGAELRRRLRELGPERDTFTTIPPSALRYLHMDPEVPVPGIADHQLLGALPASAIDELVAVARSGSPLMSVELRHTGGAIEAHLALVGGALAPYDAGPYLDLATEVRVQAVLDAVDPGGVFTRA